MLPVVLDDAFLLDKSETTRISREIPESLEAAAAVRDEEPEGCNDDALVAPSKCCRGAALIVQTFCTIAKDQRKSWDMLHDLLSDDTLRTHVASQTKRDFETLLGEWFAAGKKGDPRTFPGMLQRIMEHLDDDAKEHFGMLIRASERWQTHLLQTRRADIPKGFAYLSQMQREAKNPNAARRVNFLYHLCQTQERGGLTSNECDLVDGLARVLDVDTDDVHHALSGLKREAVTCSFQNHVMAAHALRVLYREIDGAIWSIQYGNAHDEDPRMRARLHDAKYRSTRVPAVPRKVYGLRDGTSVVIREASDRESDDESDDEDGFLMERESGADETDDDEMPSEEEQSGALFEVVQRNGDIDIIEGRDLLSHARSVCETWDCGGDAEEILGRITRACDDLQFLLREHAATNDVGHCMICLQTCDDDDDPLWKCDLCVAKQHMKCCKRDVDPENLEFACDRCA